MSDWESPPKSKLEFALRIEKMVEEHRDEISPEIVEDLLNTARRLRESERKDE